MSISDLVTRVATPARLHGNAHAMVTHVASPADATSGSMVFCHGPDAVQTEQKIKNTKATIVVSALPLVLEDGRCHIITEDPVSWFIRALEVLLPDAAKNTVHPGAIIAEDVHLGMNVSIGPGTVVESGCHIGDDVHIGANCLIGSGTKIGKNTFIQNQVTVGSVGLGYYIAADGDRLFFPHLGCVLIGENVVVGSGCVLVKGQLDDTLIADECRLGNLVNIGHNVHLGVGCVISSSSCVAGGARIGDYCEMGIGVTINAKITLGQACRVGMGSVVTKTFPSESKLFGNPARHLPTMEAF